MGIDVSRAAINNWRARRGMPSLKARHTEQIPWEVADGHRHRVPGEDARARRQASCRGVLREQDAEDLDRWLAKLEADDLVVGYDRGLPDGWFYHVVVPGWTTA